MSSVAQAYLNLPFPWLLPRSRQCLSVVMDSEDPPPPPYSAVDPLLAQSNDGRIAGAIGGRLPLRGAGNTAREGIAGPSSSLAFTPANFESAVAYFEERPPTVFEDGREVLLHHLTIYPRSQAKDFPRRPRCWNLRTDEITQQDWDMFLRYLFPPNLGLASASGHLSRQLRAQIQRDRKDRPQETDEQRRLRTTAVIEEWNQCFFAPRAVQLVFKYNTDPGNGLSSSLCPKCYPAATKANQRSRSSQSSQSPQPSQPSQTRVEVVRRQSSESSTSPAAPEQSTVPQATDNNTPAPSPYSNPYGMAPAPYAPYGPPALYPSATPPNAYPIHAYPPLPPSPYHHLPQYQYGWNNRPYGQSSSSSKGGPLGWISSLASQAQKYGERITERAEQYGDQLSAHAEHYSRQVEDQARWLEGQWPGRKADNPYLYANQPRPDWNGLDPRYQHYYYHNYNYPSQSQYNNAVNVNMNPNTPTTPTTTNDGVNQHTNTNQRAITCPTQQRTRSASLDSTASDSSFASIDSLSTTSELSSSDLVTVRVQLLSLEDHHDRGLYEAAVGLRRQLEDVRKSRRGPSGHGWSQYQHQHQRNWTERRAVKEEMRATRKAFRDVMRRAREEQREKRRIKRNRRRQEQRLRQQREESGAGAEARISRDLPLEIRLENMQLEETRKHDSQPTIRSSLSTARSVSSSATSEISSISTPSTASLHEGERQNGPPSAAACGGGESEPGSKEARRQQKEREKDHEKHAKDLEKQEKKSREKQKKLSGGN